MGSHPQLSKEDTLAEEEDTLDSDSDEDKSLQKPMTWREKLAFTLGTNKVQYTIIALVIIDSVIVIFELLLDMGIITIPEDHHAGHSNHTSDLLANNSHHVAPAEAVGGEGGRGGGEGGSDYHYSALRPSGGLTTSTTSGLPHPVGGGGTAHPPPLRLLHNLTSMLHQGQASAQHSAGGGWDGEGSEAPGPLHAALVSLLNATANATLEAESEHHAQDEAHHAPNKHMVEHFLHIGSLTILSLFLVEVVFKVLAEGTHLLKHKAEVFDAVVVVVSFTMDITFTFVNVSQATQDYTGLLVLLRLWRVTRIINGVILSVKMDADKKVRAQKRLREKAEKQVIRLNDKVDRLTRENAQLRSQISVMETGSGEPYTGQDLQSDRASRRSGASGSVVTFQCGGGGDSTGNASAAQNAGTGTPQFEAGQSCGGSPDGEVGVVKFRVGSVNSGSHHPHHHHHPHNQHPQQQQQQQQQQAGAGSKTSNRFSGGSAMSGISTASQQGSVSYQGSSSGPPPTRSSSASSSLARQAGSPRGSGSEGTEAGGGSGGFPRGDRPSLSKQASFGSSTRYSPSTTTASSPQDSQRNSLCRDVSAHSFSSMPLQPSGSDGGGPGGKPSPGKSCSPSGSSSFSSPFYSRSKAGSAASLRSPTSPAAPERQQLLSYEEAVSGSTGREEDDPGMELRDMALSSPPSPEGPLKKALNSHFVTGVS